MKGSADATTPDDTQPGTAVDEKPDRRAGKWNELPDEATSRRRRRWWREIFVTLVLYEVYSAVRNTFGSNGNSFNNRVNPEAVATALGHAHDVINIEKYFGLFFEPHLQDWYLNLPNHGFIRVWNVYYGSFHFIVPVIVLFWLYRVDPRRYPIWRNTLAVVTLLGLVGFAGFSLMPPRLLAFHGEFGGCSLPLHFIQEQPRLACRDFGFTDTLMTYGGLWNFGSSTMARLSNQYAAMPSLHIGWSTWCAVVMVPRLKRTWKKVLVILYPIATLFCILVTANHYWLDAFGGLVFLTLAFAIGSTAAHLTNRWSDRRDARRGITEATVS